MKKINKTKHTLLPLAAALVCLLLPAGTNAQMLIKNDGRVTLGNNTRPSDDPQAVLTLSIQGPEGEYNAGAKLGFGDFGRQSNNGWNVFIGEWSRRDTDELWLHGKNGIRLTVLNGHYLAAEWTKEDGRMGRGRIYDGIQVDRLIMSCDDKRKEEITPIESPLHRLLALSGVQYRYYPVPNLADAEDPGQPVDPTDKDLASAAAAESVIAARLQGDVRYGLLAQEVAHVFPELVEVDKDGHQYVNYLELIPVLISAVQELAGHKGGAAFLLSGADIMDDAESSAGGRTLNANSRNATTSAVLYQNTPNPFSSATEIAFFVPDDASSASIHIFNLSGLLLQTYPIVAFGHGSVEVSASSLVAGMYLYTLVVDNQIIDSKRMILTE
ncbi:MAG: T9SS type A sorting domain-containing protein [Bacteroidales bacterium]|nr:T9SS type A sorting domain-containing protein [Bacteroidales bacterium]